MVMWIIASCLIIVGVLLFGALLLAIGSGLRRVGESLVETGEDRTPRYAIRFGIELVVASVVIYYIASLNKIPMNIYTYLLGLASWFVGKLISRFIKKLFKSRV